MLDLRPKDTELLPLTRQTALGLHYEKTPPARPGRKNPGDAKMLTDRDRGV